MAENIIKLPFWGNTSCNLYGMHIFKSESLHFPVFATIINLMLNRFTAYSQYQPPPVSLLQIGSIDARSVQKNTRRHGKQCTSLYIVYLHVCNANVLLHRTTAVRGGSDTLRTVCSSGMDAACINQ